MKLYNTLTKKIEEFFTIEKDKVKMYVCGPTVYDYIHIGNARPIIIFDCLRRYLEKLGYNVKYIQNFTDIDDKIINRANEEKKGFLDISDKYIEEYKKDAKNLNVKEPTFAPRVTENINLIVELIEKLIENKNAYEIDGNVYFDVASFKEYGKLSNMPLEELESVQDVVSSDLKKNKLDFVLWKSAKKGEPYWQSPWGNGRPGWHIECSAMAQHFLGDTIDIHCGGQDLVFPHHENEIAQSESATGKKFSNFWLHNGHVKIDGKKMSKSLGNFYTVREIGEKYGYDTLRFLIVSGHYKMPINFTKESLEQSKVSLSRIYNFKEKLEFLKKSAKEKGEEIDELELEKFKKDFFKALEEDFNTALAVSVLFVLIRWFNGLLNKKTFFSISSLNKVEELFLNFIEILGIAQRENCYTIPEEVLQLNVKRQKARKEKDYVLADMLRKQIEEKGFYIEETRNGVRIYEKEK